MEESLENRLNHLEQNSTVLEEKVRQTVAFIAKTKFECEQLIADIKHMKDWLKLTEQQLNKYLVINLSTAEEKNEAANRMLVSFVIQEQRIRKELSFLLGFWTISLWKLVVIYLRSSESVFKQRSSRIKYNVTRSAKLFSSGT